jgi:hypothetical protein
MIISSSEAIHEEKSIHVEAPAVTKRTGSPNPILLWI